MARVMTDDALDALIQEAQILGGHRSKSATVNAALAEFVERLKQSKPLDPTSREGVESE